MANILVAGGAGFIGSQTLLALAQDGHTLTTLDNLSNGFADNVIVGDFIEGDLHDAQLLDTVLVDRKIDAIIHFAAFIEAGVSVTNPMDFYDNNVAGSLTLIQAMVRNRVRKIVFSSTAAVYGQQDDHDLLHENLAKQPINPYGQTKWMVECMLRDVAATGDMEAICLRYFNAAGSDPDARLGERHDPETHLIPLVLDAARGVRDSISIFGTDYATEDGTCIRDYIHVADLADAHSKALALLLGRNETPGTPSAGFYDAMNLGTSRGHSVREVIETAKQVTGVDFPVIEKERRPGDPARLVADATRANKLLNWQPQRSDLKTMIADAWRFRQNL